MSRLEELMKELCPEGVEWKRVGEVCEITKGRGLSKSDKGTGDIPIILYGELYTTYGDYIYEVMSYAAEDARNSLPLRTGDVVMPVSSTTKEAQIGKASVYCADEECFLGGDAIRLRHEQVPGYLAHLFNGSEFEKEKMKCVTGTTINHLNPNKLAKIKIPVPPVEVQREIVKILDNFTELTAELDKRRKQYEYYRDLLLTFGGNDGVNGQREVRWVRLGEIGEVKMCKRILKSQTNTVGGVPFYKIGTFGGEADAYISEKIFDEYKEKYSFPRKGDILISAAGTIGRTVIYDGEPAYFQDSNIVWLQHDGKKVLNRYLFYCYQLQPWRVATGGTIGRIYNENILNAKIPLPSMKEQERIVGILDRFNKMCHDISEGLPAEIEMRRKQYEYYRDKLLRFEEVKNEE